MQTDKTATALHLLAELEQAFVLRCGMPVATIGVNENRVRLGEFIGCGPLTVEVNFHIHLVSRALRETFR